MTNEEVVEELRSRKLTMSMCIDIKSCRNANNAIEYAINSIQENTKLKAEIEQLKNEFDLYYKLYLASIDARGILTECVEQLKEELKQSVRLPCKVGDVIYRVNGKIIPMTIESVLVKKRNENVLIRIDCVENEFKGEFSYICDHITNDIGKSIFLTREEAEQSLKAAQP